MFAKTVAAAALATALVCSLAAAPAQAQRARVFVASYGTDNASCGSFLSPCRNFQQAVNNVADSGEVTAIDSAGFGPINITKGVTITSPNGVEAGIVTVAGGAAITINATANDAVILRGLTLTGANTAAYGVVANSAGKVEIIDSVVRDFSTIGILANTNANMLLHISNTKVMNTAFSGISLQSAIRLSADIDNVTVVDNNQYGIQILGDMNVTIRNSDFGNNGANSGGCNLYTEGDSSASLDAFAWVYNTKLGEHGGSCGISQVGFSVVTLSQSSGGSVSSSGNNNQIASDGTNIFSTTLPNSVVFNRE